LSKNWFPRTLIKVLPSPVRKVEQELKIKEDRQRISKIDFFIFKAFFGCELTEIVPSGIFQKIFLFVFNRNLLLINTRIMSPVKLLIESKTRIR